MLGSTVPAFFQLLIAQRFSSFGYPDNFYQIVRSDSGSRFAAQNIIQARECAALVIQSVVVEERIADPPPSKTIDNDVELVFGRAFGRWPIPGEDTLIESVHFIDDRYFNFQPGVRNRAHNLTETRDDHSFVLEGQRTATFPI